MYLLAAAVILVTRQLSFSFPPPPGESLTLPGASLSTDFALSFPNKNIKLHTQSYYMYLLAAAVILVTRQLSFSFPTPPGESLALPSASLSTDFVAQALRFPNK